MTRRAFVCVVLLLAATAALAQPAIPSPAEFLGYEIGERFTPHHRILAYFETLAKSSGLITVRTIGTTYEDRPLILATLTSVRNQAMLETIRANAGRIARGEGDPAELAKSTPAVVWLAFGVHGNESSSAESSMMVAHALLTNPDLARLLDDLVVIIDPLENPDGRERYTQWFHRTRGMRANPDPATWEHQEPWPGGRFNHYLIDMNRDWAWQSQRETRARVTAYREWPPQVFVDFHEMSFNSSYFFPPAAKPLNANLPKAVEDWLDVFGRANAAEFSRQGWPFFVAEHFDLFYPGYGDSWPSLQGAIGMTYEMGGGGRAGSAVEREDGTILTLADRALRHYATAITTVRTAAQHRTELLRYAWDAARTQIDGGRNTFLIGADSPHSGALAEVLQRQGIRVEELSAPVTLRATRLDRDVTESRTFPAGTIVVSTRQPRGALANTLLEKAPVFSKGFVEEQRARAEADEPDSFYDLTTWSLPLAMNVEGWVTQAPVEAREWQKSAPPAFRTAQYGYLVEARDPNLYRFVGRLLEADVRFSVVDSDITSGDRSFARGSLIILKGNNRKELDAELRTIAGATGVSVVTLESGWMGGIAFGSEKVRHVKKPKVGLVGGPGSDPTSFGMLWHTLDVDTPIPHDVLSTESLRSLDLHDYGVLVFPDGNYSDRVGKPAIEKIKRWVDEGGTLVAVKGATAILREKDLEISKLKPWSPKKEEGEKNGEKDAPVSDRYNDYRVPGSAFRTVMGERSYLTFGVPRPPAVLVEGSGAFLPLPKKVDNVLTIQANEPLISGVAWDESLERIQGSVYVAREPVGRGQVVTFADDPHFRLFWRGTLPIFLNAVVYGPTFAR